MIFNHSVWVATLATLFVFSTGTTAIYAQTTGGEAANATAGPGRRGLKTGADPTAGIKASMKSRFGFTDAQATTAITRIQAIAQTYRPKIMAIQKKYSPGGQTPTPEQQKKFRQELLPLYTEMTKKTNAVLLSVTTKAQRPKVLAQIKAAQQQMEKLKGGKM